MTFIVNVIPDSIFLSPRVLRLCEFVVERGLPRVLAGCRADGIGDLACSSDVLAVRSVLVTLLLVTFLPVSVSRVSVVVIDFVLIL